LHAGKGTNHENSGSDTFPETVETDFSIDFFNLGSSSGVRFTSLVKDGNHSISWVRNDGAEHTGNITGHEGNHELGTLGVRALLLGEDLGIELSNNLLEADELDNGVWNLSSPEWFKSLVESVDSFTFVNSLQTLDGAGSESTWLSGLHFNFKCFPWAEETIGNDLSACGGYGETESLIFLDVLFRTSGASIDILEHLIETEFTESLERVTNPGWDEAGRETNHSFGFVNLGESISYTLVHTWHCLFS